MNMDRADKVIIRTAKSIGNALNKMVADLPKDAAPQMAIKMVLGELAVLQPWFMSLIMEDPDVRESYAAAVAAIRIELKG